MEAELDRQSSDKEKSVENRQSGDRLAVPPSESLRESEARFRALVDQTVVAVAELDLAGNYTLVNARFCEMLGYSVEELLDRNFREMVYPEDLPNCHAAFMRVIETGEPVVAEKRMIRKDGSLVWISDGISVILDGNDQKHCAAMVAMDITQRKLAEEHLESLVRERTAELAAVSEMRQELLHQLVTAQEEERGRIARDLHDDMGQQVTAMTLGLENLKGAAAFVADPQAQATLAHIQELASEVAKKSHRLSFSLRPTALDDTGLIGALANYTEEWSHWSGIPVAIVDVGMTDADGKALRLSSEIETTIYRVVQEALTNVLRHAKGPQLDGGSGATQVDLLVQRQASDVVAIVEDNGPGFDVEATLNLPPGKRRLGLFGMQERARLAGGSLTVESTLGEGCTVHLRLPLAPPT